MSKSRSNKSIKTKQRVTLKVSKPSPVGRQIGFIAINKKGEHGAYCLQKGFNYAVYSSEINNQLINAKSLL